jgi:hypothetical protein
MKLKKILSLTMALAMVLALAVPALATDATTRNIGVGTETRVGVIDITIPATGTIVLNPYQMKATTDTDSTGSYHQIWHVPVSCKNKSTFGLNVNAVITGELGDDSSAQFVATAPKDTSTSKDVFLYAEFGVSDKATTQPTWATEYNKSNANQVLIALAPAAGSPQPTAKTVATLGATNGTDAGANYLWLKFDGALSKTPSEAWSAGDTVSAAVALTLIPTVDTVYKVNVVNTTSKTADGTVALNYDLAPAGTQITVTCTAGDLGGTPTVTVTQGSTKIALIEDSETPAFVMPAGDVTVTVKWTAS